MSKISILFTALLATTALWASNVITYTASNKLPETTESYDSGLHTNAFNVAITIHSFSNGQGIITFAGEVTKIGELAFNNSAITTISIPSSVSKIELQAFNGCNSLLSIDVDAANTRYISVDGVLFTYAQDTIVHYPAGNSRTEYTIPNSVTKIGDRTFLGCEKLFTVNIPNGVTSIGDDAFGNCSSLVSITIPGAVQHIGNYAFAHCPGLTSITVESGNPNYTSEDGALFNHDKTILIQYPVGNPRTSYTIPCTVQYFGSFAFRMCSTLKSVILPEGVKDIGWWTFGDCTALESIVIPNSVTHIEVYAFSGCSSLRSITMGNSIKDIGWAFDGCDALQEVHISDIAAWCRIAFWGAAGNPLTYGKNLYLNNELITNLEIPDTVTCISNLAFYNCTSLTSVTIPASVDRIGDNTFSACTNLTSITCNAATPPTCDSTSFLEIDSAIPVYVLCGSKAAYCVAKGWSGFSNIIETFPYTIRVTTSDSVQGSCKVDAEPDCEGYSIISAAANYGYHFVQWNDGKANNPRAILLTKDTLLTAMFAINQYEVKVLSNDSAWGIVLGGGVFPAFSSVRVMAAACQENCTFSHWSDGSTIPGRYIELSSDTTITAYFVENEPAECIEVSVNNPTLGVADIQIVATPVKGCTFVSWLDGITDNPRTVTHAPGSYMAVFTGIPSDLTPVKATITDETTKLIKDSHLLIQKDGKTYNAQGGEVK